MLRTARSNHCPRVAVLLSFLSVLLVCSRAHAQSVVLYENPGFGGQAKTLITGPNSLSDFQGLTSSIRVPLGLVAVLYQHADTGGGYGVSIDLLEDCPNLAQYSLDNSIAYVEVFSATKEMTPRGALGRPSIYFWARNSMSNGQFVPGHWERERAGGNPPNNVAVPSPPLPPHDRPTAATPTDTQPPSRSSDPGDLANVPPATQADIDEFNSIRDNQYGVGVLSGDTKKPFYVHQDDPDETTYKYKKVVDAQYFDGAALRAVTEWVEHHDGRFVPLSELVDLSMAIQHFAVDIWETMTGERGSTLMAMDSWYPVSEMRTALCGTVESVHVCSQDFLHTKVTVDRDMNIDVVPNPAFAFMANNRWIGRMDTLEGEVRLTHLRNVSRHGWSSAETLVPKNPLIASGVHKGDRVGLFGPWMADVLDLNLNPHVPFTSRKLELVNIGLQLNNEIHPINQMWIRHDDEIDLVSMVDKTGYFEKANAKEIQASGYNQKMRYYLSVEIPENDVTVQEYQVNGIGFDFAANPERNIPRDVITLNNNGRPCLKVDDNSLSRANRTHHVFFDKMRRRADGSFQGYIVVETVPIILHGGSINVFVKKVR